MQEGLLIERVTPGGPAEQAGLHGGNRAVILGLRRVMLGGDVLTVASSCWSWVRSDKKNRDVKAARFVVVQLMRGGDGNMVRRAYTLRAEDNDFGQAGTLVRHVLDDAARSGCPRDRQFDACKYEPKAGVSRTLRPATVDGFHIG